MEVVYVMGTPNHWYHRGITRCALWILGNHQSDWHQWIDGDDFGAFRILCGVYLCFYGMLLLQEINGLFSSENHQPITRQTESQTESQRFAGFGFKRQKWRFFKFIEVTECRISSANNSTFNVFGGRRGRFGGNECGI